MFGRLAMGVSGCVAAIGALRLSWPTSRDALEARRDRRLRRLVGHAYRTVPYYRRLFDEAGLKPERIRGASDLPLIPMTSKDTLRGLPLHERLSEAHSPDRLIRHSTAGSSGEPMTFWNTWLEQRIKLAFRFRAMHDYGMTRTDLNAIVGDRSRPARNNSQWLNRSLKSVRWYRQADLDVRRGEQEIAAELEARSPDVLTGYPSILTRVADWITAERLTAVRPRFVTTDSEVLNPAARRRLGAAFDAPVYNIYDSQEANLLAWECKQDHGLPIAEDAVIVEVVRDGRPARSGETGEIVITPLFTWASPLIRYRIGDIATAGPAPCPCGLPFATLQALQGRTIEYFRLTDGRILHPFIFADEVYDAPWVKRYRVGQVSATEIVVSVVPERPPTPEEMRRVETNLARIAKDENLTWRIELVDDIPNEESGKYLAYYPLFGSTAQGAPEMPTEAETVHD